MMLGIDSLSSEGYSWVNSSASEWVKLNRYNGKFLRQS